MIVSGYTLDLYCDTPNCPHRKPVFDGNAGQVITHAPTTFFDETGVVCRRMARKAGWVLNLKDGTAYCPGCVKTKREQAK